MAGYRVRTAPYHIPADAFAYARGHTASSSTWPASRASTWRMRDRHQHYWCTTGHGDKSQGRKRLTNRHACTKHIPLGNMLGGGGRDQSPLFFVISHSRFRNGGRKTGVGTGKRQVRPPSGGGAPCGMSAQRGKGPPESGSRLRAAVVRPRGRLAPVAAADPTLPSGTAWGPQRSILRGTCPRLEQS